MTQQELEAYYRTFEQAAHKGVANGSGMIARGVTGSDAVGKVTAVAVDATLKHVPQEVKFGSALGAGLGAASAAKCVALVGGIALAPAVGVVAMGAAVVGATFGVAAAILKASGMLDEK